MKSAVRLLNVALLSAACLTSPLYANQAAVNSTPPIKGIQIAREGLLHRYLRLTPEQRTRIDGIVSLTETKVRNAPADAKDLWDQADAEILAALTEDQQRQLEKLRLHGGLSLPTAAAVASLTDLTDEQRKHLQALAQETLLKRVNLFYDFDDGPSKLENPRYRAKVEALDQEAARRVEHALSPQQLEALKTHRQRLLQ